jgi:uncharacterized protein (TIGR03790 family)
MDFWFAKRIEITAMLRHPAARLAFISLVLAALAAQPAAALTGKELGLIINAADPLSVRIGEYYARMRQIPAQNILRIRITDGGATLSAEEFAVLKADIDARTPKAVQAYALTWVTPERVECMSITSAFAFGFDRAYCAEGCAVTRLSPYFDSNSRQPYNELKVRPTMSIAATTVENARALINRGVAASQRANSGRPPPGRAYLVETDDAARNVRAAGYADAKIMVAGRVPVEIVHTPGLKDRDDVLFYFIGARTVPDLETNHFVPGAVADHLTSTGGNLLGFSQMSSLRWLEAGATGSYGTVVEPCNFTGKFPNVGLLMRRYLNGETLIEAYWKSVAMPGQGIFIGEPLATLSR